MSEAKKKIQYMIFDVDGTLTDGKLYIGNNGEMFKAFHVKDGCAIYDILPAMGINPVILTARRSEIVEQRCKELNVSFVYQGVRNKKEKILELIKEWNLELNDNGVCPEIAYIGDDLIDLECMGICGFTACPHDAADEVKEAVQYVSPRNAGEGAVRDIVDYYKKSVGKSV